MRDIELKPSELKPNEANGSNEFNGSNGHGLTERLDSGLTASQEELVIEMAYDPKNSLKKVREAIGLGPHAFYACVDRSPRFAMRLARARNESFEDLADSLMTIYDDEPDVNKARGKSDNIKWLLAKRKPTTYGDKIELNVQQTIDIGAALSEARARASLPVFKPDSIIPAESFSSATDKQSVDDLFT